MNKKTYIFFNNGSQINIDVDVNVYIFLPHDIPFLQKKITYRPNHLEVLDFIPAHQNLDTWLKQ
jgi:hypothetical protein